MADAPPVALSIKTLVFPPILLCLSAMAIATLNFDWQISGLLVPVGAWGALLAVLSSWVIAPVSIYSLFANPANRTIGQITAVCAVVLVMFAPLLAVFGGGD